MDNRFNRTEKLLGTESLTKLADSRVLVFGAGGVGGFVCEALARTGVGTIGVCDMDNVDITNINRQVLALSSTVGRPKVDVMKERMLDINPEVKVETFACRLGAENIVDSGAESTADSCPKGIAHIGVENHADTEANKVSQEPSDATERQIAAICECYDLGSWDYVVDAIDDVPAKILLTLACKSLVSETRPCGVPVILSMGTGNKLDITKLRVADISKTHTCPLAKAIRTGLRKKGVNHVKCVFSEELPMEAQRPDVHASGEPALGSEGAAFACAPGKHVPATCMFVPAAAGLLLASEVVKDLTK